MSRSTTERVCVNDTRIARRRRLAKGGIAAIERARLAVVIAADADEIPLTTDEVKPLLLRLVAFEQRERVLRLRDEIERLEARREALIANVRMDDLQRWARKATRIDLRLAGVRRDYAEAFVEMLLAEATSNPQGLPLARMVAQS